MAPAQTSDGQRKLEVRVRIIDRYSNRRGSIHDCTVEFTSEAKVSELTAALLRTYVPEAAVESTTVGLYRTLLEANADVEASTVERGGFLPANMRVIDCGLIDGAQLTLKSRADQRTATLPLRDMEQIDTVSELFLVDELGTHRGRVTWLPQETDLTISALAEPCDVVVDDLVLGKNVVTVRASGGSVFVNFPGDVVNMLVSGEHVSSGSAVLTPGSTMSFRASRTPVSEEKESSFAAVRSIDTPDETRVSFSLATGEALVGKTPFGRVRLEPAARKGSPNYADLPERFRRLGPHPKMPERPEFHGETIATTLLMAIGFAFISKNYTLLFLAPIVALPIVWQYFRSIRTRNRKYEMESAEWKANLTELLTGLTELVGAEEANRELEDPETTYWTKQAYRRWRGLWSRNFDSYDFLRIRVGQGLFESRYSVSLDGVDIKDTSFEAAYNEGRHITPERLRPRLLNSPAYVNLNLNNFGVVGPEPAVRSSATDYILQLVCAHSPGVLAIATLLPEGGDTAAAFGWLQWLPHVISGSPIAPIARVVSGRRKANLLLSELRDTLTAAKNLEDIGSIRHHVLLIVHEAAEVDQSLLAEVLELGTGYLHLMWLGTGVERLAQPVTAWLHIPSSDMASLKSSTLNISGEHGKGHTAYDIGYSRYRQDPYRVALRLAPLYDPRVVGSNASVPSRVSLSSVIDIRSTAWTRRSTKSLIVKCGVGDRGILSIDLVRDGPHMVVGGTTGSGKSELLQTMVATIISTYAPTEVVLMLVDFKGGSTFSPFKKDAHVVGYVSDLDGPNVHRSLAFLQAEVRERLKRFAEAGDAKEYADYRRWLRKSDTPKKVLPRLVVIFDEFATLVKDYGDEAQAAVVDIAQRGRSLGVHLILATQRPSSDVVGGKIRANVRARVALQTLSADDSITVIDSPEAALIPRDLPGRAFLRLEGGSLVEFQAAYAGAGLPDADSELQKIIVHDGLTLTPKRAQDVVDDDEEDEERSDGPTELQAVLDTCVLSSVERSGDISERDVRYLMPALAETLVRHVDDDAIADVDRG